VFQARYGFSKVSSVSMVGGRPVGVGIDIVNPRGVCCDIDAEVFTVLVNRQIFSVLFLEIRCVTPSVLLTNKF
jgi:hypothetical protein